MKTKMLTVEKSNEQKMHMVITKSRKYLLPCLKEYGEEFIIRLNSVYKVAIGIGDMVVKNRNIDYGNHIFILINSTVANLFFVDFLEWIKGKPMYEDDYVFGNIQISTLHMIVLKIPDKYVDILEKFKLGSYSKMYSVKDVDNLFSNKQQFRKVMIKSKSYRIVFVDQLNELFGTTITPDQYEGELDFPPNEEEIFNNHIKNKT